MKTMQGVNLGGWLVLERWITPSLFADTSATDEYSLCRNYPALAQERITQHRSSFINERTIAQIAQRGFNTVRLPIGYWLFGSSEPFVAGADVYVDKLFEWCDKHAIGVILDIHAVVGSQNGWDHSGRSGEIGWGHGSTVSETLDFLDRLMVRFGNKPALVGLEVLNEPHWQVDIGLLIDYYRQAYQIVRAKQPNLIVIMSDSFRPHDLVKKLKKEDFTEVLLDVHLYQLFTEADRALTFEGHIQKTETEWAKLLKKLNRQFPIIVGEWSSAMHELHQPIEQPEHVNYYTQDHYDSYFKSQRDVFDSVGVHWTYWTAKTEQGGPWSLLDNPLFLPN